METIIGISLIWILTLFILVIITDVAADLLNVADFLSNYFSRINEINFFYLIAFLYIGIVVVMYT